MGDAAVNTQLSQAARKAELLEPDVEYALACAWRDNRDEHALHRLTTAHMRLAISMASKYRRYNVSMSDLIQEAGLGLMKAAEKFDPDRGVRFSTYAIWWIKAAIQDHVMRNWSMVRTGSTSPQKSLFFNLKRVRARFEREALARGEALDSHVLRKAVAQELGVSLTDVETMEGRMSGGDFSLNAVQSSDEDGREWIDTLEDENAPDAAQVEAKLDAAQLREWLVHAMGRLTEREKLIIRERKLRAKPRTLEALGDDLSLSKERVRQLEAQAFQKMRDSLVSQSKEVHNFLL